MRKFLVVILVAILLLGAGAALGEWYARNRLMNSLNGALEPFSGGSHEIELDSFPLLLDLAKGSIPGIDGTANRLEFDDANLTDVAVTATEITTGGDTRTISALDATAATAEIRGMTAVGLDAHASDIRTEPLAIAVLAVTAQSITAEGVTFERVMLDATEVTSEPDVRAEELALSASVSSEQIETLVIEQTGPDTSVVLSDGIVHIGTVFFGQELSIGLEPQALDGGLAFVPMEVTLGGFALEIEQLPFGLADQIEPIPVELPLGPLRMDAVNVTADGFHVELSGTNVRASDF